MPGSSCVWGWADPWTFRFCEPTGFTRPWLASLSWVWHLHGERAWLIQVPSSTGKLGSGYVNYSNQPWKAQPEGNTKLTKHMTALANLGSHDATCGGIPQHNPNFLQPVPATRSSWSFNSSHVLFSFNYPNFWVCYQGMSVTPYCNSIKCLLLTMLWEFLQDISNV